MFGIISVPIILVCDIPYENREDAKRLDCYWNPTLKEWCKSVGSYDEALCFVNILREIECKYKKSIVKRYCKVEKILHSPFTQDEEYNLCGK